MRTRPIKLTARPALAAATLAILSLLLASPALAAVPSALHVEGFLSSGGGGPIADGKYDLKLGLHDAANGGNTLWSDTFSQVEVTNGHFAVVLGTSKALPPTILAKSDKAWLSVKVGNEPELTRLAVAGRPHAMVSAVAEDLACTGCVNVAALKIDGDLDIGGNALKAAKVVVGDVKASTVSAQSLVGDGSKLSGVQVPAGTCAQGKAVGGVAGDGKLICVDMKLSLPKDGIGTVSNGLLTNQFDDVISSTKTPVAIPDNNPIGTSDEIQVPDIGIAQKLTVSIDISNSNLKSVNVLLYDPANAKYTLWDKSGAGGKLVKTFPTPDKTLDGDLTSWTGKNPKGTWRLRVIDSAFLNNASDGAINKWSVNIQTLSNQKIQVKGTALVDSHVKLGGSIKLGNSNVACDAASAGSLRFNGSEPQWCDGNGWTSVGRSHQATYRWQIWSTYGWGGWYAGNNASLFGGVNPSTWGDSNGRAYQMSSDSSVLRTFFTRRGPAIGSIKNALVYAEEWVFARTSTDSKHVGVLFRVRNNTSSNITWNVKWYRTAYAGWGERTSVAVNGQNTYDSGGNHHASDQHSINLSIPKNRTSTVIFIAGSCPDSSYMRSTMLAFYSNSLALPKGLEFVDDLDTKPNGWNH